MATNSYQVLWRTCHMDPEQRQWWRQLREVSPSFNSALWRLFREGGKKNYCLGNMFYMSVHVACHVKKYHLKIHVAVHTVSGTCNNLLLTFCLPSVLFYCFLTTTFIVPDQQGFNFWNTHQRLWSGNTAVSLHSSPLGTFCNSLWNVPSSEEWWDMVVFAVYSNCYM